MRLDNVKERIECFRPSSNCIRHVTLAVKNLLSATGSTQYPS
jgi:hypothetical protein